MIFPNLGNTITKSQVKHITYRSLSAVIVTPHPTPRNYCGSDLVERSRRQYGYSIADCLQNRKSISKRARNERNTAPQAESLGGRIIDHHRTYSIIPEILSMKT